jgi:phosphatidylserine decarboxylase
MIRFGSRVNCEIPADYQLNVGVGEKVSAGSTILARRITGESGEQDAEA